MNQHELVAGGRTIGSLNKIPPQRKTTVRWFLVSRHRDGSPAEILHGSSVYLFLTRGCSLFSPKRSLPQLRYLSHSVSSSARRSYTARMRRDA
ncbi:MAG: hypothetical protein RJA70_3592 [Pseudomonadota bacterium]|jgi:hypothetical protein